MIATASKEFWPTNAPAVMLGQWCYPPFGEDLGEEIHQNKIIHNIECKSDFNSFYENTRLIQENLILLLAKTLNEIHNVNYPPRYWRILIGPWLKWYVNILYDRYNRLKNALNIDKNITLIGLNKKNFITINKTSDFINNVNYSNLYNLQLITQIAEFLDIKIDYRKSTEKEHIKQSSHLNNICDKGIKKKIHRFIDFLQKKALSSANICLYSSGHPRFFLIKLFFISFGKIVNINLINQEFNHTQQDEEKRKKFKKIIFENSSKEINIEKFILSILSNEFPLIYLEDYSQLACLTSYFFKNARPKEIYSAVGWHTDEIFKCWAGSSAINGAKLIGIQHGGNYGILNNFEPEHLEMSIVDTYVTWGWKIKEKNVKIITAPAPKLISVQYNKKLKRNKKKIIFVITTPNRYFVQILDNPEKFPEYIKGQVKFLNSIHNQIFSFIHVRPHAEDKIWNIKERLKVEFPNLMFETWDISFKKSISTAKIIVCDHLSTTFIEALASNIPTVLFWDPEINSFRIEAKPFFEALRRVGVLHDTPESAANLINEIWKDVENWWNDNERQRVVANFCHHYARTSKAPIRDWLRIFKNIKK